MMIQACTGWPGCCVETSTMASVTTDNTTSTSSSSTTSKYNSLTSQDFLKIMFSELSRQDPTKPTESKDLMAQLNSIRSIEANIALETKLDTLVAQNQLSAAGGLIGSYVTGLSDTNNRVEGQVVSINQTKDGPVLNLTDGWRVPFKNVDEIMLPPSMQNPGNDNPGGGNTNNPSTQAPATTADEIVRTFAAAGATGSTIQQLLAGLGGGAVITPSPTPAVPQLPTTAVSGESVPTTATTAVTPPLN